MTTISIHTGNPRTSYRTKMTFDVSHLKYRTAADTMRNIRASYRFARRSGASALVARYLTVAMLNNVLPCVGQGT